MDKLLIKNVIIIDSTYDEPLDTSILIEDGIIKDIGRNLSISDNTKILDGEGRFILPGFIDMHSHLMANGFHYEDNMRNPLSTYFYNGLQNAKDTIYAGVTTVRDCGLADIGFKNESNLFRFPMPKLFISVCPLCITRGHFDYTENSGHDMRISYPGMPRCIGDGKDNVLKMTRECFGARADFIKVMASGGILSANGFPQYPQFNIEELKTIVDEASSHGAKVAAHCHSISGMENCIAAGVSSIEHATFMDKKTAHKIKENNIVVVPTLIVHKELYKNPNDSYRVNRDNINKLRDVVKVHEENIKMAYEEGVTLLMGTDSGVIDHGLNLHELKCLCDIGMSEKEAIAAGTINAAKFLDVDNKIGSISKGKDADLILTDKNPLDNIEYLSSKDNIEMVIREGRIIKNQLN